MPKSFQQSPAAKPTQWKVEPYSSALSFARLTVGVDNVRHDVFLSPGLLELGQRFLFELILQQSQPQLGDLYPSDVRSRSALLAEFRRTLLQVLQGALTQAKQKDNIEIDILARLSLYKWLTAEMQRQFAQLVVACKGRVQSRSGLEYEGSVENFRRKAKVADFQANKRHLLRAVAETLFTLLEEVEESNLRPARLALFGCDFGDIYAYLRNRLVFLENPSDAHVHIEHYVMLGHFANDADQEDQVVALVSQLLKERVLLSDDVEVAQEQQRQQQLRNELLKCTRELHQLEARLADLQQRWERGGRWLSRQPAGQLQADIRMVQKRVEQLRVVRDDVSRRVEEAEQNLAFVRERYSTRVADILCNPANVRELFGAPEAPAADDDKARLRAELLAELSRRLDQAEMLRPILASYYLKAIYKDFCPPLNPQQLKKAVLDRREREQLELLLEQFSTREFPLEKLEGVVHRLRRISREETQVILRRFVRDLANLRRDTRHSGLIGSLMEKIQLITDEKTRRVSELNGSLYEFLLPEEQRPSVERVLTHVIVKADIRDSSRITAELLTRGLNPATHFSQNFYEPVRKILDRYTAAKVFIEGDALILAIYESEANRAYQRPVAKACCLARDILQVCHAYNQKAQAQALPTLELGLGVAFHGSAPTYWVDGETRIMISRAINLADRLSGCSRLARRIISSNTSPFNLFLFRACPVLGSGAEEDEEELLFRYNVNGVEVNEDGFEKLGQEIALTCEEKSAQVLGHAEKIRLHYGVLPLGTGFEKLVIREARVPIIDLSDIKLKGWSDQRYFEVCVHPGLYENFPQIPSAV